MYYDRFNEYNQFYKKGLLKITSTKSYIELGTDCTLVTKHSDDNYKLTFTPSGLLNTLSEYKYDRNNKLYKINQFIFTYDKLKNMRAVLGYELFSNLLTHKIEFSYNDHNLIEEEYYCYFEDGQTLEEEIICSHLYQGNYHKMEHYECLEEKKYFFETHYDSETGTVDEKITEEDQSLFAWNRKVYNKSGQLTRESELNENGETETETEYFYEANKIISIYYGEEKTYWETVIENDSHHHRIQKNHFRNGDLCYIEEQTMEYYK